MFKLNLFEVKLVKVGKYLNLSTKYAKTASSLKTVSIYRYDPENSKRKPRMSKYELNFKECGFTVLDVLDKIKSDIDPSLTYRRSCREGICGSCAMNINGVNSLACIHKLDSIKKKGLIIYPLPHMYVIKDLVVDMNKFYQQYASIEPWLQTNQKIPIGQAQLLQSVKDRQKLDGLYECILCACCTTSCPEYWWNAEKGFLGAAALLNAYRWIIDSRDEATEKRLNMLRNKNSVYKCKIILNCTAACPKNLNPGKAIAEIKKLLSGFVKKDPQDLKN